MRKKPSTLLSKLEKSVVQFFDKNAETNLVDALLMDHEDLKSLIKILKDSEESIPKKKVAFARFKSLLTSHSEAEERALYSVSKHMRGLELKTDEGRVEHQVANSFLPVIRMPRKTADMRHWKAQIQVLGELVEHHLKEEEEDLFPEVRKKIDPQTNKTQAKVFIKIRRQTQKKYSKENAGVLKTQK